MRETCYVNCKFIKKKVQMARGMKKSGPKKGKYGPCVFIGAFIMCGCRIFDSL
jgi:hypothetical protein